jgi:hypothetical protein
MLAQRTEKLIEELKPDNVLVQTSAEWWNAARSLKYVNSQEEFRPYAEDLDSYANQKKNIDYYWPTRQFIFRTRLWLYKAAMQFHYRFGPEFNFTQPGLEVRNACQSAQKVGAKLTFLGSEMNRETMQRL